MKRVWVVDDMIPAHALYAGPLPTTLEAALVRHLVEQAGDAWDEASVLNLCRELCASELDATFFTSPDAMLLALRRGATPPHAVIFDWEYPASNDDRNCAALDELLHRSFTFVQVYTHLGEAGVEPKLNELRERHAGRLLPTRMKADVTPAQLADHIRSAWTGTIAGDLADRVRDAVVAAVERSLVDMCSVPRGAIAAMTDGAVDNLVALVLSKVRDEIGAGRMDALDDIIAADHDGASSAAQRSLMSVWYYLFPADQDVRRGDLVEVGGGLGLVVTPPCDLARFPKKTGRRLTWLRCVRLDQVGVAELRRFGYKIDGIGNSIIANHGQAGDAIVVLPNVPRLTGRRDLLDDYAVLCHGWESRLCDGAPDGPLKYCDLGGLRRLCSLAEPFASAVAAKVAAVISSPGTPDLSKGERRRLREGLEQMPAPAGAAAPGTGNE